MVERDEQRVLRDHLRKYLNVNDSSRSMAALARKTGLAELTVRRITQGESTASFESAVKLLKATSTNQDDVMSLMRKMFPEITALVSGVWAPNNEILDGEFSRYLVSAPSCYIISLASSRAGVTREVISSEYGRLGTDVTEEMLASGVLIEKDGVVRLGGDNDFSVVEVAVAIARVRQFVDAYDPRNRGHLMTVQSESVNREGFNAIRDAIVECAEKIAAIRQDPKYTGDIQFYFCGILNRLLKEGC